MERTELRHEGAIALTDDDRDIASITPGGYFRLRRTPATRSRLLNAFVGEGREIELRGRADGTIERRFRVNGSERPFDPEGRAFLADVLIRLVRRTGFAADARISRFLERGGPAAVIGELALLEGDFVRREYVRLLTLKTKLSSSELGRLLQAIQISSDFETAEALRAIARAQTLDSSTVPGYLRVARTIGSDYELRRALLPAVALARTPALASELFDVCENLNSDYEQAEFLIAAARAGLVSAAPEAFFDALVNVGSDYEHRRVLEAVSARGDVPDAALTQLLRSTGRIGSDFERAEALTSVPAPRIIGDVRAAYLSAANGIRSEHERNRALQRIR